MGVIDVFPVFVARADYWRQCKVCLRMASVLIHGISLILTAIESSMFNLTYTERLVDYLFWPKVVLAPTCLF